MKRFFPILLGLAVVLIVGVSIGEAWGYDGVYPNGDKLVIFSSSSWDGWNHVVLTFNNQDYTASATVLDPYGNPVPADFGYYYFWADFYTDHFDFYGSMNGENWVFLGSYY